MISYEPFKKLTKTDIKVLSILWSAPEPLTASQMASEDPSFSINTVQATIRKLLSNNYIEVSNIVYSGTVLARTYKPTLLQKDFALAKLTYEYHRIENALSIADFITALLQSESDSDRLRQDIKEIRQLLEQYESHL
ncbi:MAG: penicillinase repressor [Lachnospiraceae bacterium]|nr:penicillinase repressor [Robinsoniella sp.]MDY3766716.1 penicillinase repressor [Lachnospiraceae bacterium]